METRHRVRPEELLEHVEWARALARRLVGDEGTAEDVVQEGMVAALERPPREEGPLRPWLFRVLVNAVRQRARAEGRRRGRERAVAREEGLPSAAELTERAEGQRRLVGAVLELGEAQREVVLLRYFEGLSSAEIARRQGVPAGTVRARLKRGLDALRERLDEGAGGRREEWRRALAPLAAWHGVAPRSVGLASLLTGAFLTKALLATAAVVLVGLGWIALDVPLARPALESVRFAKLEEVVLEPATGSEAEERIAGAGAASPPPVAAEATSGFGTLRLRFVDGAGVPVPGVEALAYPTGGRPAAVSDGSGRVALAAWFGSREGRTQVAFARTGFASDVLHVDGGPGRELDLGEVRLHRGGAIEGRVVDGAGSPVAGVEVFVEGREVNEGTAGGMRMTRSSALGAVRSRTADDGSFRLAGVLAGEVRVEVRSDDALWRGRSGRVEVRAGEVSGGLVVAAERVPAAERIEGVVLDPAGAPLPWVQVRGRWSTWFSSGSLASSTDREGRFRFVLPRQVPLELEVHDPDDRWTPVAVAGVAPGTLDQELRFAAGGSFVLCLVDGAGAPVARARLSVAADGRTLQVLEEQDADGRFVLRLPAQAFEVDVLAEGFAERTLAGVEPARAARGLELELRALPGLHGRVSAGGEPVEGALVRVFAVARQRQRVEGLPVWLEPQEQARTRSRADGTFSLTLREPGRHVVRAEVPGLAPAESAPIDLDPEVGRSDIELALGGGGAIEGSVVDGVGLRETHLVLASRGDGQVRRVRTDPEGRFRIEHCMPGPWMLRVEPYGQEGIGGSWSTEEGEPFSSIEGDCVVVAGRTTLHDLYLGERAGQVTVAGRLRLAGGDPTRWTAELVPLGPGSGGERRTARLSADGTFRVAGPGAGRHALLLVSDGSEEDGALRLLAELELAAGETPFELDLALGEVLAGPAVDVEADRLLWRGPLGVHGLATFPAGGGPRAFPAGTVERIRPDPSRPELAADPRAWPVVEVGRLAPGGTLVLGR